MRTKPILEKLADEYGSRVEFIPINADDSREILESFRIFGIPTVIAMRDGKEIGKFTGVQSEAGYRTMFESLAANEEVKILLTPFDRILRLGAGGVFVMIGVTTGNWIVGVMGGMLAFLGIYDRCPIWNAIVEILKRR